MFNDSQTEGPDGAVTELYEAVRRIHGCLDSLPDFLLTCAGVQNDPQLRLLQKQVTVVKTVQSKHTVWVTKRLNLALWKVKFSSFKDKMKRNIILWDFHFSKPLF